MAPKKTAKPVLIEYLFVDEHRLRAYVEQIGPPLTYDKVPVWSAEIGLTGPKAAARQERAGRKLTLHEQVNTLVSHLREHDLLFESRPSGRGSEKPKGRVFVLESCKARRLLVPPVDGDKISHSKGLKLWLSFPPDMAEKAHDHRRRIGMLLLLEDFHGSDEMPHSGWGFSAFTVLGSLLHFILSGKQRAKSTRSRPLRITSRRGKPQGGI